MPSPDCIYTGSLLLGQDNAWNGQDSITGLCLYTDDSSEKSQICDASFQLKAITHLTAIKLYTLRSERYRVAPLNDKSKLGDFLAEVFNEEFNLSGTTRSALIIHMSDPQNEQEKAYQVNLVLYGEKAEADPSISVYAHPMYDDNSYLPAYEITDIPDDIKQTDMAVLCEIFGTDHEFKSEEMMSSMDIVGPTNRHTEEEMMALLASQPSQQDTSSDIIKSAMTARKETHKRRYNIPEKRSNRLLKSVPYKYISSKPAAASPSSSNSTSRQVEYKKNLIRKAIVKEFSKQGMQAETSREIFQLAYTLIRHCSRHIIESTEELNPNDLGLLVKMNVDHLINMETMSKLYLK
ncbi:hypothetical protein V8B55DRAFT_1346461 [Mucor lusitanicus]|uniref:Sld7 C-terminal domain-containing protein n=1 Tax=Mucor lusitanicus CBS 277.49 TaxID=747725 RepID=A0A162Z1N0_MUCCL|nr:hypothetical protein MUCCIDRAFT_111189 [Mucor lusitanicus CBS 277.49]